MLRSNRPETIDYRLNTKFRLRILSFALWFLLFSAIVIGGGANFCGGTFTIGYAQDRFIYSAKGKRNPFIPLVTSDGRLLKLEPQEGQINLTLEGIIYDKIGTSYAIVNSQILKVGDTIDEYRLLKIEEERVVFMKDGQPIEIELDSQEVKDEEQ